MIGELLLSAPGMLRCLAGMDPVDVDLLVDHVVLCRPWAEIEAGEGMSRTTRERRWLRIRLQVATVLGHELPAAETLPPSGRCLQCGVRFERANPRRVFCCEAHRKRYWRARSHAQREQVAA